MKQLTCEMCGGHDLVKQDGVFVCQNCGTKYSVEEAKKMMVEGTVAIKGTIAVEGKVAVDKTNDIDKLFVLARREKEAGDKWKALKYYSQIEEIDPSNWEAYFYTLYYNTIDSSDYKDHDKFRNGISATFEMLTKSTDKKTELEAAIKMMSADLVALRKSAITQYYHTVDIFGETILKKVPQCSSHVVKMWKKTVKDYLKEHEDSVERDNDLGYAPETLSEEIEFDSEYGDFDLREFVKKIQHLDPTYQNPLIKFEYMDKKIIQEREETEELEQTYEQRENTKNTLWVAIALGLPAIAVIGIIFIFVRAIFS